MNIDKICEQLTIDEKIRHIIILIYRVLCQFIVFLTGGITYV